jgi:hypothetical protein
MPTRCLVVSGDARTTDAEIATRLASLRASKITALTVMIRTDVRSGVLPPDTDAVGLARYSMAVLAGLAQAARDGIHRSQLRRVAQIVGRARASPRR